MGIKLIYVIGPYRSDDPWEREQNIRRAEEIGMKLAKAEFFPVIPHANTRSYFEKIQGDEFWLEGSMELLRRCDGYCLVNKKYWELKGGALAEVNEAEFLELEEIIL
jgi:hypothetical protein